MNILESKQTPFYHKGQLNLGDWHHAGVHQSFYEEECGMISETSFHVLGLLRKTRIKSTYSRKVKRTEIREEAGELLGARNLNKVVQNMQ